MRENLKNKICFGKKDKQSVKRKLVNSVAMNLKKTKVFLLVFIVEMCSAFSSGDGMIPEIENDDIVEQPQTKSTNNDYKDLTTLFDPFWLANLWPQLKGGAHLSLDGVCLQDLTIFFSSVLEGKPWTFRAVDSIGHVKSGLLWGNEYWIGSKEQCDHLDNNFNRVSYKSLDEEFLYLEDPYPPFRLSYSLVGMVFNITKISLNFSKNIHVGMCLPRSCRGPDIYYLIDFSINMYETLKVSSSLPRSIKISSVRILDGQYTLFEDSFFYTLCSIVSCVLLLSIIGTIVETRDDNLSTVIEEENQSKPKFRQLCKSDISDPIIIIHDNDSSIYTNNNMTINNNTNDFVFGLPKKSMESIFTVDGLIQNKFSDNFTRNDNFFNMQKFSINIFNEQEALNKKKCKKKRTNSLKKRKISTDNSTMVSDHRCKKQKYSFSEEETGFFGKFKEELRNAACFQNMKCVDKSSNFATVLMCFSMRRNFRNIISFELADDNLSSLHGMRAINLVWVLLIQTVVAVRHFSDNKANTKNHHNFVFDHSTYAVDTFFVLSGLLTSYSFTQFDTKTSLIESVGFGAAFNNLYCYLEFIIRKYFRYICPYLIILCLSEVTAQYFHANFVLEFPDSDHNTCSQFWWRNVLFINTFYSAKEMCIPLSWYASTDMQFYSIAILILMLSTKWPKVAAMLISIILLATWSIGGLLTIKSLESFINVTDSFLMIHENVFDKPWLRVGPYITGMGAGWLLSKTNCCLIISKVTSLTLWIISLSILFSISFGLYGRNSEHNEEVMAVGGLFYYINVAYTVMGHTTWALAIAWIVVACATGYGGIIKKAVSNEYLFPVSRLSYCMYLLHPLTLKIIVSSAEMVLHYSVATMAVYFLGTCILTSFVSLLFSLFLESPVIALLKLTRPDGRTGNPNS